MAYPLATRPVLRMESLARPHRTLQSCALLLIADAGPSSRRRNESGQKGQGRILDYIVSRGPHGSHRLRRGATPVRPSYSRASTPKRARCLPSGADGLAAISTTSLSLAASKVHFARYVHTFPARSHAPNSACTYFARTHPPVALRREHL